MNLSYDDLAEIIRSACTEWTNGVVPHDQLVHRHAKKLEAALAQQAQPLPRERIIEAIDPNLDGLRHDRKWVAEVHAIADRITATLDQQAQPECKCGEPLPHSDLVIFANHPEAFGTTPVPLDNP